MRKFLLLFFAVVCVQIGAWAQDPGQYWLFHEGTPNTGNNGDKAIVGADLYKSVSVTSKTWTPSDPSNGQNYNLTTFTDDEKEQHESEVNSNNYYKVPVKPITYYRLALLWTPVDYSETNNGQVINSDGWDEATINEVHLNDGNENDCVRFATGEYDYYVATMSGWNVTWEGPTTLEPDQIEAATVIEANQVSQYQQDFNNNNNGNGTWYYKVAKYNYYKKKKAWSDPMTELPEGQTPQFKDWAASDLQNHLNENPGYYALASSFNYYYVEDVTTIEWQPEEYTDGQSQYQLIALYSDESEMVAPTESNKYCTVGGDTWTKTDGRWVSDTPAIETGWDPETGTLFVAPDETKSISELMQEYNITAADVNKVVFDGGEYNKTNSTLTATSADYEAMKDALETADFTVSKMVLGDYVTIENGVTIFTVPNNNTTSVLGSNIDSNLLTAAEKDAIKKATDLKLVGKITKDDWAALNDKAGTLPEGHSVESLDLSAAIINDGNSSEPFVLKNGGAFKDVTYITMPNDPNYKSIPAEFAQETDITSITIPSQVEVIGANAFHACSSLETVSWDLNGSLKVIGNNAFSNCNISGDIVIPTSVERIEDYAFADASHISSVTFPKGSRLSTYYGENNGIGDHAFWMNDNNDLDNVYVLEDDPAKLLACHHDAFDYDNTDGQTQMSTVKTRLHYPPSLYYYYVGEWKSRVNNGKVEGQEDLLALRNCVDNYKGSFKHRWVDENGQQHEETIEINLTEDEKQWVNGFQKFVSSGIPVTFDAEWRTYSDVVNLRVPAYDNKVADVYIVCGYEASEEVNGGRVLLKQMVEGDIIPAHTGIIIHHYVKDQVNGGLLMFPHVQNNEEESLLAENPKVFDRYCFVREGDSRMTYHEDAHEFTTGISTRNYIPSQGGLQEGYENGYPNYLEFLDCKGKKRVIYNAENGNIIDWPTLEMGKYSGQKVTYRNFLFGNGIQIQHAKEEADNGNVYDRETNPDGYRDYTDASGWDPEVHGKMGWGFFRCMSRYYTVNSKAFLHFPAEVFDKAKGGATTAIVNANVIGAKPMSLFVVDSGLEVVTEVDAPSVVLATENGGYYTLQGVKVEKPSKSGIYIHNGKKVVIK